MQNGHRAAPQGGETPGILGSNQAGMRAHNERLVLTLIRRHGPTAKADIARTTGLSAQTVSVIMRALEADGLLVRGEPVRGRVGQPSVPMALAPDGAYFLGLLVGRRSLGLVMTDFLGEVVDRVRRPHDFPAPDDTVAFVLEGIETLASALPDGHRDRIAGLGIAMPYQLWDWAETLGMPQDEMNAWRNVDLRAEIAARTDFPVFLQNDASSACAAELVFGTSEAPSNFLHFFIAFFIGGGVVLNGGLYSGPSGNAGALGSLPVPGPDGKSVQLLDVSSLSVLARRLVPGVNPVKAMWAKPEDLPDAEDVLAAWVDEAAAGIAHAVAAAVSVIDFEAVLIDGWIPAALRSRIVAAVADKLARIDTAGLNLPVIRAGTIGPDARALGAASLPLSERFLAESYSLQKPG